MKPFPEWAVMMLKLAGIASAFWGLTFTLFPDILFRWAEMPEPQYLFPWKITGVVAIIFGIAYFIAAFNPRRHMVVIWMGFILKLLEQAFMLHYWADGIFPMKLMLYFTAKDLIWLFPFAIVIYLVLRNRPGESHHLQLSNASLPDILAAFNTESGKNLKQLSDKVPVLLIFLRHFAFCRKMLSEIQDKREAIEKEGVRIVLVHMGKVEEAGKYLSQYNLQGLEHISDPHFAAYNAFNLKKGNFLQIFDPKAWIHELGSARDHNLRELLNSSCRMPGIFLIYKGELLKSYRYEHISDEPDYVVLATQEDF